MISDLDPSVGPTSARDLRRRAKEFLDALPTASDREAEAGFKCFALSHLAHDPASAVEQVEADALLEIVTRAYVNSGRT